MKHLTASHSIAQRTLSTVSACSAAPGEEPAAGTSGSGSAHRVWPFRVRALLAACQPAPAAGPGARAIETGIPATHARTHALKFAGLVDRPVSPTALCSALHSVSSNKDGSSCKRAAAGTARSAVASRAQSSVLVDEAVAPCRHVARQDVVLCKFG